MNQEIRKALLLINVGSPDTPEKKDVKRFLKEFLNDKEVIDLRWLYRKILVNLIIIPFRINHSTKLYKKLFKGDESPLIAHTKSLTNKLNSKHKDVDVYSAMRYGNPSLTKTLEEIHNKKYEELTVLPLYPQYARSTTETTINAIKDGISKWGYKPQLKIIKQFYNHPSFMRAICSKVKEHDINDYEHIIFSYHALPIRQINKVHPEYNESECTCDKEMPTHGKFCYKACCYETTRLISKELNLEKDFFTTCFQSRMSKNWTKPFTTDTIIKLAKAGKKKILIISPAFVADCLETTIELAEDGQKLFQEHGGDKLQLIENLNDSEEWVNAISEISYLTKTNPHLPQ